MIHHWVSCRRFTVSVRTDDRGTVVWAAPLVRTFVGQPLENLLRWVRRKVGPVSVESWLEEKKEN